MQKNYLSKWSKRLSLVLVSSLVLMLTSCGEKDSPKPINPDPKPSQGIVVPETTKVITEDEDEKAEISFNEEQKTLTVENADALDKPIKKGDIVVSGKDGGYLLKVETIEQNGKQLQMKTSQATIEEAFQDLELTLDVPIEEQSEKARATGTRECSYYTAVPVGNTGRFIATSDRLRAKDENLLERKFEVALDKDKLVYAKGTLKFSPMLKGDVTVKRFTVKNADIGFEIKESLSIEYSAGKKWDTEDLIKDKKLGSVPFKDIIIMAGGVPIAIRPELDFYVGMKASVEGKVFMEAKQEYAYNVGLRYDGSKWTPYKEESFDAEVPPPSIKGELEASAYIKPVLSLRFYRIVAPQIDVETGVRLKGEVAAVPINGFDIDWSISAYLDAYMGIDVSVLGKSVANYKTADPILKLTIPLLSAKDFKGNKAPEAALLISPADGIKSKSKSVNFNWSCEDPDGDDLVYDLYVGTKTNGQYDWTKYENLKEPKHSLDLDYGTYYWKVVAREVKSEELKEPKEKESLIASFTIEEPNAAPTAPKLERPKNNESFESNSPLLTWGASTDANGDELKYRILLSKANEAELNIVETDWTNTKYQLADLSEGTYKWQVIVSDGKAEAKSEVFTFVVKKKRGSYPQEDKILVEGGSFMMGDDDGFDYEKPAHKVTVPSFYIGKYEVTNQQFSDFLNAKGNQEVNGRTWLATESEDVQIIQNNGKFIPKDGLDKHPVVCVTWDGAKAYAEWVGGRLPSEAEWEYAARGGRKSNGTVFSGSNNIDDVAWYGGNSDDQTHQVGIRQANELGLYDMTGNVWEWCQDLWHENYDSAPTDGRAWMVADNSYHIYRGGSWFNNVYYERVSCRYDLYHATAGKYNGFRVCWDAK